MSTIDMNDVGAIVASSLSMTLFLGYYYYSVVENFSLNTSKIQLSRNVNNALKWLEKHTRKPDAPSVTLAIQTLRNTILVAIFVGGSSFTYGMGFLSSINEKSSAREVIRSVILGILLFASFLSWASVIRSASHLGYLVGILELDNAPADDIRVQDAECGMSPIPVNEVAVDVAESPISKLDEAKRIGSVMLLSFSLGFRFIFVSIPFAFYSAGPYFLVGATVVILIFLYVWDHVGSRQHTKRL